MKKKKGIVLFDEGIEGMEIFYVDHHGFLKMPKKQNDEITRQDSSIKKRVLGLIKDDINKY